jgi:WD40 repeat protein
MTSRKPGSSLDATSPPASHSASSSSLEATSADLIISPASRTARPDPPREPLPLTVPVPETPGLRKVDRDEYDVELEIARGGLGRILKGWDRRLQRPVAIKELLIGGGRAAARFVREARVSARLQHPSIVPVYEAGRWPDGELFYTMKMISGASLKEAIDKTRTLDERLVLVPNIISVADAMAYAHGQRVIHRDLKPSNILVGPFGETVVIDWGLAKELGQDDDELDRFETTPLTTNPELTMAGSVLGTPQYMPPEQARGEPADESADVYTLGAVLYHMLAGRPPFDGTTPTEVLTQVLTEPPTPLEERQPGIPKDLLTIVHKAMAYNKAERYPTARELAEDLRRFQAGQLVSAREYSSLTLAGRWLLRHSAFVSLTVLFLAILLGGAFAGVRRIVRERNTAKAISDELRLVQARTALDRDPTATLAWLKTYPVDANDWKQVRELAIEGPSRGVARHVFRRDNSRFAYGAFSPDGRLFACAVSGHQVRVWDTVRGKDVIRFNYSGELSHIKFSPDGKTVVFTDQGRKGVTLGDIGSGQTRSLGRLQTWILAIAFSPDGRFLLSGSADHVLRLWSLSSGEQRVLSDLLGPEDTVGFSPDGRKIAFAGQDQAVHLWDVATGKDRVLVERAGPVKRLFVTPDGKFLVTAIADKRVQLWDVESGRHRTLGNSESEIVAMAVSPDGRRVAAGELNGTVRQWSLDSGKEEVLGAHQDRVFYMAFSPDGRLLASGSQDATVRLWEPDTGDSHVWLGHSSTIRTLSFSSDGRMLSTSSDDETVRLWDVPPRRARLLRGHEDSVYREAFSPDGRRLATGGRDQTVRLWDLATGAVQVLAGHSDTLRAIKFSPDGTLLVSLGNAGALLMWDVPSGTKRLLRDDPGMGWGMDFSPDSKLLGLGSLNGLVHLCELATSTCRTLVGHTREISALAFSPDGQQMITGGNDRILRLWDVATGASRILRGHQDSVEHVSFSPDGRFIVSAGSDGALWRWNASSGEGRMLGSYPGLVKALRFSPDSRTFAVAGDDGMVQLWDLAGGTYHLLPGHRLSVRELKFSPDGALLASGSWDGTIRLWDVRARLCRAILRQGSYVMDVAFSPDGRLLASPGLDKIVRLWRLESMPTPPDEPHALRAWLSMLTAVTIQTGGQPSTP